MIFSRALSRSGGPCGKGEKKKEGYGSENHCVLFRLGERAEGRIADSGTVIAARVPGCQGVSLRKGEKAELRFGSCAPSAERGEGSRLPKPYAVQSM